MPIIEKLLMMPDAGPERGTAGYIKRLLKRPLEAEFEDLMENKAVMTAYILKMQSLGDSSGAPRLRPNEKVPSGTYKMVKIAHREEVLSPSTVSHHSKLRFLRSISHKKAISVLLDKGL